MSRPVDVESLMQVVLEKIDKATEETRHDISEIRKDVSVLRDTTIKQQSILEEHVRRTDLNEKAIYLLKDELSGSVSSMNARVVPLERHVNMWSGFGKGFAILSGVAGFLAAIMKILRVF